MKMKKYEKPRLMALSLSGNDMLCSCAIDAVGDNMDPALAAVVNDWLALGLKVFTDDDNTCEAIAEGYCKFTGDSNMMIFNS